MASAATMTMTSGRRDSMKEALAWPIIEKANFLAPPWGTTTSVSSGAHSVASKVISESSANRAKQSMQAVRSRTRPRPPSARVANARTAAEAKCHAPACPSFSRDLSDTTVWKETGKPPLFPYGAANTSPSAGGCFYGQNLLSHNKCPEESPNSSAMPLTWKSMASYVPPPIPPKQKHKKAPKARRSGIARGSSSTMKDVTGEGCTALATTEDQAEAETKIVDYSVPAGEVAPHPPVPPSVAPLAITDDPHTYGPEGGLPGDWATKLMRPAGIPTEPSDHVCDVWG
jgi:hypothetical protein